MMTGDNKRGNKGKRHCQKQRANGLNGNKQGGVAGRLEFLQLE